MDRFKNYIKLWMKERGKSICLFAGKFQSLKFILDTRWEFDFKNLILERGVEGFRNADLEVVWTFFTIAEKTPAHPQGFPAVSLEYNAENIFASKKELKNKMMMRDLESFTPGQFGQVGRVVNSQALVRIFF